MKIAIYLSGSIKKGSEGAKHSYWTEEDLLILQRCLSQYEISFLNPSLRTDDLSDQKSVFGRDMTQVYCSDIVLVDARDRRGLGIGAEMMWAKANGIPVITWAPKDTHYHKKNFSLLGQTVENWVHPFVESLSDAVVETLTEAAEQIYRFLSGIGVKGSEWIHEAMHYYRDTQLENDEPMKHLVEGNAKLKDRIAHGTNTIR